MYSTYVLDEQHRDLLSTIFRPKYQQFIGHHVTVEFGIDEGSPLPEPATLKIVGTIDNGEGLEALVVSVNGKKERPNGGIYHITWSLEPNSFKPADSNELLKTKQFTLIRSIPIEAEPKILK